MAQPMKDQFGPEVPAWIGQRLSPIAADLQVAFDPDAFQRECLDGFDDLALMARARRIAAVLAHHLPADPHVSIPMVRACLGPIDRSLSGMAPMRYLPLTFYVADVGLGAFEESMAAQYELTRRFTAEFSIRPFLIHEPDRTLAQLRTWAVDQDEHVRRLVSEGTRPRLPWATRLPAFIADPTPVLALLELLADDPSPYVRRSVANNLNDISKDHPDLVIAVARRWWSEGDRSRRRLVRHALRTLVKRGDPAALDILGHGAREAVEVVDLSARPPVVAIGGRVQVSATVRDVRVPGADKPDSDGGGAVDHVALDFVIHFVKANGATSPRVFKGAVRSLPAGGELTVTRTISVAQLSTRTHHPGTHRVEAQVNGRRLAGADFEVVPAPGG
jgi:3-methyladenine DNA glycosylase AlkC